MEDNDSGVAGSEKQAESEIQNVNTYQLRY